MDTLAPDRLLPRAADWAGLRAGFAWPAPARLNMGDLACGRWARATPERPALTVVGGARWTYGALDRAVSRFANVLSALGVGRGDRVAILLPQTAETAIAHLACYRMGAIAVPLFTLFGEDGLRFRLADCGAVAAVTDGANLPKLDAIRADLPALCHVFSTDGSAGGARGFWDAVDRASDRFAGVDTGPGDPALISYTSGTTGPPKGALHGHRVLLGHLPGVILHHDFLGAPGDCLWTPADWAWMGGLMNVMLPALALGVPLVAHRAAKFDPEAAVDLMARNGVRNVFLPPTALKLMRQAGLATAPPLRTVASGGESLGAEMLAWGQGYFGRWINEFYGQTECNLVLSNCAAIDAPKPGAMGRPVPGHAVAVIGEDGTPLPAGAAGEVAIRRPDPAMFLEYWGRPEKTAEKFIGDWMRTGDVATVDEEGWFHFAARTDDVITSSGYRIGPTEIEDCLAGHEAVAMAAVIGVPDPIRTEAVKAFVVLRQGASEVGLADALIARVRARISPHVAPREVAVVDSLPLTATGKIMRRALRDPA